MSSIAAMRAEALRLFQVAIEAANPATALRTHLPKQLAAPAPGRLIVVAVGKAACPMLEEALAHCTGPVEALAVTNYENAREIEGATVLAAGHPVPDENGLNAAEKVANLLADATQHDRVVALISGGGSALLPLPVPGISLADKAKTAELLLASGLDITQMNMVRQQLSQIKGGGMARIAAPAPIEAYIISDVVGDDLGTIASGPTVAPIGTKAQARACLQPFWDELPKTVQDHFMQETKTPQPIAGRNILIGSNRKSLDAIVSAQPKAQIIDDRLEGNVAQVAPRLAEIARHAETGAILLFGGETTVTVSGTGKGGRNQDLALRMALAGIDGDWVFLSGGTDGRDGPTDAAGGLVDPESVDRMRRAGLTPEAHLSNNDAYHALKAADDLIVTGATGTNVADIQILLKA